MSATVETSETPGNASRRERVVDKDEAVHRVKRQPVRALGIALWVGLAVGLAGGSILRRLRRRG